ncbi:ABC transporter substrate-binding protein [Paenibacillus selenitireducens]|uniref:ABC transporter substrate-binding protein n=2 Tax=Paenibacillus selenitireducens TaxID=1324314 RepID=A0A1T2X3L4_9BACL|nr:ABC transporter substrate-binding protein [Paenibacillus selenitireducens]
MNMSKKRFKTMAGILAVVLLAGSVMGCTGKKEETASKEGTTTTTTPEKKQKISMMYPLYNNPPKKTEVWKAMEEKLNIEYEPMAIPSAQYNDKLLASIAANDLADITHYTGFPDPKFTMYAKQGAFLQLDELIKDTKYIKDIPQEMWDYIKINGKIYGIPRPGYPARAVLVRKDWLDNLGLSIPKTLDEFYDVAVKFAKEDPDQNGKDDTVGMLLDQTIGWNLDPIYMAFDTGNGWRKMEDNTLMNAVITPQRKEALTWLNKLYKAGGIDQNFTIMKGNQTWEKLESGKAGLFFAGHTNDYNRFVASLKKVDPKAELIMIRPPVGPTGATGYPGGTGFFGQFVLPSQIDKDKAKKAIELLDWEMSPEGNDLKKMGIEGVHHTKNADGTITMIGDKYSEEGITNLIWQIPNEPMGEISLNSPAEIVEAQRQNMTGLKELDVVSPAVTYIPSDAVSEKLGELDKIQREIAVKLIIGTEPIEAFDKFVEEWKAKGGAELTKEVNEWYKNQNK